MTLSLKVLEHELAQVGGDQTDSRSSAISLWPLKMTYTEKAKLHLARALIMNAEVLVLQRPLSHYDEETGIGVLQLVREHVLGRGLMMPKESAGRRRPRTCFFVPET